MFSAFRNSIIDHSFISPAMSPSISIDHHSPTTWHAALKFEGYCWYVYIFNWHHRISYATSEVETKFGSINSGATLIVRILEGIS
jgi:hypothetical protein